MSPLTRRHFLQLSGAAAGSLVVGCSTAQKPQWSNQPAHPEADAFDEEDAFEDDVLMLQIMSL